MEAGEEAEVGGEVEEGGEAGGKLTMEEEGGELVRLGGGQSTGGGHSRSTITRLFPRVSQTMSKLNIFVMEKKLGNRLRRLIFKGLLSSSTRCTIHIASFWIVDMATSSQPGGQCKRTLTTAQKMGTSTSLGKGHRIAINRGTMEQEVEQEVGRWRRQGGRLLGQLQKKAGLRISQLT